MRNQSIRVILLTAFGLILGVFGFGTTLTLLELQRAEQARAWTINGYEVVVAIQRALAVLAVEANPQQRYVDTPSGTVAVAYDSAHQALAERLVRLGSLLGDHELQQSRLSSIAGQLLQWRASPTEDPASSRRLADRIRRILGDMERTELALLAHRNAELAAHNQQALYIIAGMLAVGMLLGLLFAGMTTRRFTNPLVHLAGLMQRLAEHDHGIDVPQQTRHDEVGAISRALQVFKQMAIHTSHQTWVKTTVADIHARLQKVTQQDQFAEVVLDVLMPRLGLTLGTFFSTRDERDGLERLASRGEHNPDRGRVRYELDDVLVRCAAERKPKIHSPVPVDYARLHTAADSPALQSLVLVPLVSRDELLGMIEMAGPARPGVPQQELLEELAPILSLSFDNLLRGLRTQQLLRETREQSAKLRASEVNLQRANEALREKESIARHQATHDSLTSLPNRALFMDRLEATLQRAQRSREPVCLLYLDLDGFKAVNDVHGHLAGDALLVVVSQRLVAVLRKADTVARLGGDEFAVILDAADQAAATDIAQKIVGAISQPFDLTMAGAPLVHARIGCSIGIAEFPRAATEADALIRAADDAMYAAKRSGKNRYVMAAAAA